MQLNHCKTLVIEGIKEDGAKFRPSDWIDRISTSLGTVDKNRKIHYSPDVQPASIDGNKCLLVSSELQNKDPNAFDFIMNFAHSNKLRISGQQCSVPDIIANEV